MHLAKDKLRFSLCSLLMLSHLREVLGLLDKVLMMHQCTSKKKKKKKLGKPVERIIINVPFLKYN